MILLPDKDPSDWATEDSGDKVKVLQPKIENVLVASCGDDGTVRLWYPLQVIHCFLCPWNQEFRVAYIYCHVSVFLVKLKHMLNF